MIPAVLQIYALYNPLFDFVSFWYTWGGGKQAANLVIIKKWGKKSRMNG